MDRRECSIVWSALTVLFCISALSILCQSVCLSACLSVCLDYFMFYNFMNVTFADEDWIVRNMCPEEYVICSRFDYAFSKIQCKAVFLMIAVRVVFVL